MEGTRLKVNLGTESDCADWMSQLPEGLWHIPLTSLAIPGSHDTMTYCLDRSSPLVSEPPILSVLDFIVPCITRPCLCKWGTTQEQQVAAQLDGGIRYLDLRIAHKRGDYSSAFYFAHGIYTLLTVEDALRDIAAWLKSHRKEVVILACSMFDGLNDDQHKLLIGLIINLFGDRICPNTVNPSLGIMWKLGYQVIVSYDHEAGSSYEELWHQIPYWWANELDPQKVIAYLEAQKRFGRPDGFFVAGLNLTENARYIVTHPCQSMNSLTMRNYSAFLEWVATQSPGPRSTCLNIICGDFVVGIKHFASAVIDLNKKLL
ncbi:PI-PLC X domain-containing protein 1-like [Paramormyrops kingsleyae]|uniref:Phosphatidylinositol specific phospholipase C X domain containing 1 n=1 Tax=Paramormyrops kingsleyae TaxID=1676925 RepID=A0A3B3QJ44_9TELE|nr:PI-PLC X domain-containing protein 1-like [Paramormyrops kingsleyae]XP_023656804.1 PI-PLC X domain-containing protein 1-like [Paramormyrops kingsleyae]XP_023656805.1 PI-PLC X domain-containing protein 1-like [Paramormyrops kingsleyae]